MKAVNIRIPILLFVYTAVVLAAILCICTLYIENTEMKQELIEWQQKTQELSNELEKINRFTLNYGTKPEITAAVLRESEKFEVEPTVMFELIKVESKYNPEAISPDGAAGLCQLRPMTAQSLSKELGISYSDEQLFNIDYNIMLATYYLAKLLNVTDNDYHKALTAYNRGIGGLQKYIARTGTGISHYSSRIYEESMNILTQ